MKYLHSRVAFVSLGSTDVFPLPDRNIGLEKLNQIRLEALCEIRTSTLGVIDLIEPHEGVTTTDDDADQVIKVLRREDVDMILMLFTSWTHEEIPSAIAHEFVGCPTVLWGITAPSEYAFNMWCSVDWYRFQTATFAFYSSDWRLQR